MKQDITIENSRRQYEGAKRDGYPHSLEEFVAAMRKFAALSRVALVDILDEDGSEGLGAMLDKTEESTVIQSGVHLLEQWVTQTEALRLLDPADACGCDGCKRVIRYVEEARAIIPELIGSLERRQRRMAANVTAMMESGKVPEDLAERATVADKAIEALSKRPDIPAEDLASFVAASLPPEATFTAIRVSPDGAEVASKRGGPPSTGPKPSAN